MDIMGIEIKKMVVPFGYDVLTTYSKNKMVVCKPTYKMVLGLFMCYKKGAPNYYKWIYP